MAERTPEQARSITILDRLFRSRTLDADWFAPVFLSSVTLAQITKIIGDVQQQYGPYTGTVINNDRLVVRLSRADILTQLALDQNGRIRGLFFEPPVATGGTIADHVRAIVELPGTTAVLVMTDGTVRAEHHADEPLAVGSAFKLAILHALALRCERGDLAWDQVVNLEPASRSLPSGILQDWPDGTPITLAALAHLMISISDNTATDTLMHIVGRDALEALSPRNTPFLTTREAFVLKGATNAALRQQWRSVGPQMRQALLPQLAGLPLPSVGALVPEVTSDVEWFFTARELQRLLKATSALPSFVINPGPVGRTTWPRFAYKGGSESGVLNFSALVTGQDGRRHSVIATWNNSEELDLEKLRRPFSAILHLLSSSP